MDTSEKYAKMCDTFYVRSIRRPGDPEEGDYYYFEGKGIVVVGFDHLNIRGFAEKSYAPYIKFAMVKPLSTVIRYVDDKSSDTLYASSGTYYIYKYHKPIYCPKVDQWLDVIAMCSKSVQYDILGIIDGDFNREHRYYRQFDTMEQRLCAYYMKKEYELYWWYSDNDWITYAEAQERFKESWG